jgi:hypothetical protein
VDELKEVLINQRLNLRLTFSFGYPKLKKPILAALVKLYSYVIIYLTSIHLRYDYASIVLGITITT